MNRSPSLSRRSNKSSTSTPSSTKGGMRSGSGATSGGSGDGSKTKKQFRKPVRKKKVVKNLDFSSSTPSSLSSSRSTTKQLDSSPAGSSPSKNGETGLAQRVKSEYKKILKSNESKRSKDNVVAWVQNSKLMTGMYNM